ncbi:MAG: hypothetical protein Q7R49_07325 [Candidatus Daviesbacteria bacterium]|nr:hypothetical protein [Candidatus Daviesbacteria bacterium]
MPKSEKGIIHIFLLLVLVVGLLSGLYLVQTKTNLFPKASVSGPITPTAGFYSSVQNTAPNVGDVFAVKLLAHSDIDASNLFKAKLTFNKTVLSVDHIDYTGTFITSWVEQTSDNTTGTISLVGGVPNPGIKTTSGAPMAIIYFKGLAAGSGALTYVSGTNGSAIYRNSDNADVATVFSTSGSINVGTPIIPLPTPSPTSSPTSTPTPAPSATPLPGTGDGSGDGKVDLTDLSVLLSDYGKTTGFRQGIDMNGDSKINVFDFGLMRNLLIQKGIITGGGVG